MYALSISLDRFDIHLSLLASRDGAWVTLPIERTPDGGFRCKHRDADVISQLVAEGSDRLTWRVTFSALRATRLRLLVSLPGRSNYFHLIPGCIFGDNNAAHVHPGQFPVLSVDKPWERHRAALWEFRADRASHPLSMLCCDAGAIGLEIDPYSDCDELDDGFARNGVIAALPDVIGVSLGYGNDLQSFHNKTVFWPSTEDRTHGLATNVTLHVQRGNGRRAAHAIVRRSYDARRDRPTFKKSYRDALLGLAESFATVNYSPQVQQYTNRKCTVPNGRDKFEPWRAIGEIGWTGGSVLAYPFLHAERLIDGFHFPKSPVTLFDEICAGYNDATGFINDNCINRSTKNRPDGWNPSDINGWWSGGILAHTRDNHCAYTNAHAAYYLLKSAALGEADCAARWRNTAFRVLDTAVSLQRGDGAFGYIFSGKSKAVVDFEGFAGCWFVPALVLAHQHTRDARYLASAECAIAFYATDVGNLTAWGSPMDTYKSIDSEGNLAFIRAARLLHEVTGHPMYLEMLIDGAHYEYLWRYGFRSRPQAPPLKDSAWNSCGGSITSVSNPHIHPMSVVATRDLEYLAARSNDDYHQRRADDGMAWLMNTMELYPGVVGYGRYGVLSERTCPSDGLLEELYDDDGGSRASTWWSYNAWAAANAMEAVAEQIVAGRAEPA
ncbi:MAG: hypothetical protein QM770_17200 [Tepidisphaeraceae bacterium]